VSNDTFIPTPANIQWLRDEGYGGLADAFAILQAELEVAAERERGLREALDKAHRFERGYQESLGATPTPAQWDRLDSLQSAFLEAYLALSTDPEPAETEQSSPERGGE
jgi:hypothetical protein